MHLTRKQNQDILAAIDRGILTYTKIANIYGVAVQTIYKKVEGPNSRWIGRKPAYNNITVAHLRALYSIYGTYSKVVRDTGIPHYIVSRYLKGHTQRFSLIMQKKDDKEE